MQTDEERVAAGLAFKDREGTFSEFLLLYEEPGATGMKPCGRSLMDSHGNEFPCMRKQGKKCVRVTDISVTGEGEDEYSNVEHKPCARCYKDAVKEVEKKKKMDAARAARRAKGEEVDEGGAGWQGYDEYYCTPGVYTRTWTEGERKRMGGQVGEAALDWVQATYSTSQQYDLLLAPELLKGADCFPSFDEFGGLEELREEWEDLNPYNEDAAARSAFTPQAIAEHYRLAGGGATILAQLQMAAATGGKQGEEMVEATKGALDMMSPNLMGRTMRKHAVASAGTARERAEELSAAVRSAVIYSKAVVAANEAVEGGDDGGEEDGFGPDAPTLPDE